MTAVDDITQVFETKVLIGAYSDPSKVKYTLSEATMEKRKLELQLNFEDPLYISMEEEPEVLEIELLDFNKLVSAEEGLPLQTSEDDGDKLLFRMKIPKQMPKSEADVVAMQTI